MCGIAGVFSQNQILEQDCQTVRRMNVLQQHRGPDDEGLYHDQNCVLGHRRLAIIDLSKDGHQPFICDQKRYHLTFNGEIYNYVELREELIALGHSFRTKTDTEVLLKCFIEFGEDCLDKFNGMFAFAIYDSVKHALFLARDRFGIKPLYYVQHNQKLYFASEIKAFKAIEHLKFSLNYSSVVDYCVFSRTDVWDETFLQQVMRIPKGHFAFYDGKVLNISQWWNADDYCQERRWPQGQIKLEIQRVFDAALTEHMRSDVPVGSCLSGGLDSSILVGALLEGRQATQDFSTFTVTFPGYSFDESSYVKGFQKQCLFKNSQTTFDGQYLYDHLDEFIYANDEPTPSASYFAQFEVMRLAHQHGIKVLLDGQGGDEVFAGYPYLLGFYLQELKKKNSFDFLKAAAFLLGSPYRKDIYQTLIFQNLSSQGRSNVLLKKCAYLNPDLINSHLPKSRIFNEFFSGDSLNKNLANHFHYKLEHLLRMEDRNAMAFSVEARVPYLDHRLVEMMLGVSGEQKVEGFVLKALQRKYLGKFTTQDIVSRQDKLGFNTPADQWMFEHVWDREFKASIELINEYQGNLFNSQAVQCRNARERWKIIQLARWYRLFLN